MSLRSTFYRILFSAAFAVILTAFMPASGHAQGVLEDIFARMQGNYSTLSSLKANVKIDKTDHVLRDTDTRTAVVNFLPGKGKRNNYIRLDMTNPNENLVVIGDEYRLYNPKLNQLMKGSSKSIKGSGKAGNAFQFLSMSREQLKAAYTTQYVAQETVASTETWHILLTPKTAADYKTAELWVDKDGMPVQARINEKNGDTTVVTFSGVEKNKTISGDIFRLDPKGAKVVQG